MRSVLYGIVTAFVVLLASVKSLAKLDTTIEYSATGYASWYGAKFHHRKTASGVRFNKHHYTAAHRALPFLSIVLVTNLSNNKSEVVLITDRGPFIKKRILDISEKSAITLDMKNQGVAKVKIVYNPAITKKMLKEAGTNDPNKVSLFFERNRHRYQKMLLQDRSLKVVD